MITKCVEIDFAKRQKNEMPIWAVNFLEKHKLIFLELMKVNKRKEGLRRICELEGCLDLLEKIKCDKNGNLIFSWHNEAEMNKFIKKWCNR